MLSLATCTFLLLEIALYSWLGVALVGRYHWPWWSVAVVVLSGVLLVRALLVLHTFIASGRFSTEDPALRRLGFVRRFRLLAGEWLATVLLYTLLQPLNRFLNRPYPASTASGTPVLLVHGLLCNGAAWWRMRRLLARHGIDRCYTITLEPLFGDIDTYAEEVGRRVDAIRAETGAPRIWLIGHSMGGLVCRAYIGRLGGGQSVAGLITIASPHRGTALATFPFGENIRQMQLHHPWLPALSALELTDVRLPLMSIYTVHDNLVAPQEGCRLPNGENVRLTGIGHVALLFSAEVASLIADFIRRHDGDRRV